MSQNCMGYKLFCFPLYIIYLVNVHLLQEHISFIFCFSVINVMMRTHLFSLWNIMVFKFVIKNTN